MGGRGSTYSRTRTTAARLRMGLGMMGGQPQQDDDQQQPQQNTQSPVDGTQRITDPQQLYEFFKKADTAAADAMLAQWRAEPLDTDNRQQDTDTQRFFNYIGWANNTPEVLTEAQYQQALQANGNPTQIYHSDQPYGVIGARQFAAQYMGLGQNFAGATYRHFLSGGIHGDGTYFARSASNSAGFGTSQFRGFLNGNAKVINEHQLDAMWRRDSARYPALKHIFSKLTTGYARYGGNWDGAKSVYAAMLGYNVIDAPHHSGYLAVLDRSATTVSNKTKKARVGMSDW